MGLNQRPRQMMGFIEQEEADLRNVRPGRDVNEVAIILIFGELPGTAEVVETRVHLLEIPRVGEMNRLSDHLGIRRADEDVLPDPSVKALKLRLVKQIIAVEMKLFLHRQRHGGAPHVPAPLPAAVIVQRTAEQ